MISRELLAGPIVATIFVRRILPIKQLRRENSSRKGAIRSASRPLIGSAGFLPEAAYRSCSQRVYGLVMTSRRKVRPEATVSKPRLQSRSEGVGFLHAFTRPAVGLGEFYIVGRRLDDIPDKIALTGQRRCRGNT